MSGYGSPTRTSHAPNSLSVPWVAASSVLAGVGLFFLLLWLITAFSQWLYFLGLAPLLAGGLMFFDKRAGSDHAE